MFSRKLQQTDMHALYGTVCRVYATHLCIGGFSMHGNFINNGLLKAGLGMEHQLHVISAFVVCFGISEFVLLQAVYQWHL